MLTAPIRRNPFIPRKPLRYDPPIRPVSRYPRVRYPWEVRMTLCIAAHAVYEKKPCIVMASDWRIEDGYAGSETAEKQFLVIPGWHALYAGLQSRAIELQITARDYLIDCPPVFNQVLSTFKEVERTYRQKRADEWIHYRIARSYDWFLDKGKDSLPDTYFAELSREVGRLELQAQMLFCGFVEGPHGPASMVSVIDDTRGDASVRMVENFAAVGSGSVIAEAMLHYRRCECATPLKRVLYQVFEATRVASIAPGVGDDVTISILFPNGSVYELAEEGQKQLASLMDMYSPRDLDLGSEDWEVMGDGFIDRVKQPSPESTTGDQ